MYHFDINNSRTRDKIKEDKRKEMHGDKKTVALIRDRLIVDLIELSVRVAYWYRLKSYCAFEIYFLLVQYYIAISRLRSRPSKL